ncbi:MAG: hypothetical protein JW849_08675 [Phycisphaerae bacterium]|nr:hypothetical protein [Phycisphaerae bacterium]
MESNKTLERPATKECRLGVPGWLGIVVVFAVLYGATAQRSVNWQDSGSFQYRALVGNYERSLGLALSHPLYIALEQAVLWVGGHEHFPLLTNLLSAMGMAVALANVAVLATWLSGRRWIGVLVTGVLGLGHTVWWLATICETYSWSLVGLTGELLLFTAFLRRPRAITLAGLALLSGLGLCIHNFALLPLPVYGIAALVLVIRRRLPAWSLATALGAYLLGAGLFLTMIAMQAVREGNFPGAIASALVGEFGGEVTNLVSISKYWKENALLSGMNFFNPMLPLAVVGWIRFRRRLGGPLAAALGAITLIEILFFIRYPVPDQFMFILPSLVMIALGAAVGLAVIAEANRNLRRAVVGLCLLSLAAQPVFYAFAPDLARRFRGKPPSRRAFRDEWRYWLTPWKQNETSAEQFSRAVCHIVKPDAVVLLDTTALPPLQAYLATSQQRQDISAMSLKQFGALKHDDPAMYREWVERRPIYIQPAPSEKTAKKLFERATFSLCPEGLLYRVEPQP